MVVERIILFEVVEIFLYKIFLKYIWSRTIALPDFFHHCLKFEWLKC